MGKGNINKVLNALQEYDYSTRSAVNLNKSVLISTIHKVGFLHLFHTATGDGTQFSVPYSSAVRWNCLTPA